LKAMELLDDGAFKLFSFLCLKADRLTATYRGSSDQLAFALRKPRPVIESCLLELKAKGVCMAADTAAGFGGSLRIAAEFWSYSLIRVADTRVSALSSTSRLSKQTTD